MIRIALSLGVLVSICSLALGQDPLFTVDGQLRDVRGGSVLVRQLTKPTPYEVTQATLLTVDLKTGATTSSVTASEVLQALPSVQPGAFSSPSHFYNRFASSARFIDGGILAGIPGFQPICDCAAGAEPPITPGYVVRFAGSELAPVASATSGAPPVNDFLGGNYMSFGTALVVDGDRFLDGQTRYDVQTLLPVGAIEPAPTPVTAVDDNASVFIALDHGFTGTAATNGSVILKQRTLNFETQSGDVGLFDFEDGTYLSRISDASQRPNDRFGEAMDIDGDVAVIGAPGLNYWQATENGKAYVFDLATGEMVVELVKPNAPSTGENDRADGFGRSVAIGGGLVLVGAPTDSTWGNFAGAAFLFDATDGSLLHTFKAPLYSSFFGSEVAIDAGRLLIGDGERVYVYAVPEPSTMVIAMLGLAAIGCRVRSSRR